MNIFIGSGKIKKPGLLNSKIKMLKFILVAENNSGQAEKPDYVPCIIYNPSEKAKSLVTENQQVEFHGKIKTFSFEIAGETTYRTEVIVSQNSLNASG